jgi:DNA-directed RNA polymerase specialized sigma subunit
MIQPEKMDRIKARERGCRKFKDWDRKNTKTLSIEDESRMVSAYNENKCFIALKPIIKYQLDQIKKIAYEYKTPVGYTSCLNNFVTVGILGLVSSLKTYRLSNDVSLFSHAEPYIRESIINETQRFLTTGKPRQISGLIHHFNLRMCFNCHRRCLYY